MAKKNNSYNNDGPSMAVPVVIGETYLSTEEGVFPKATAGKAKKVTSVPAISLGSKTMVTPSEDDRFLGIGS